MDTNTTEKYDTEVSRLKHSIATNSYLLLRYGWRQIRSKFRKYLKKNSFCNFQKSQKNTKEY